MERETLQTKLATSAEPVDHSDKSTLNWLQLNVLNPAINSGIIECHNALANASNEHTGTHLTKWTAHETAQAQLGSKEWLAQTVSSGIAGILPYVAAGLIVRKPLAMLADGAEALKTERAATGLFSKTTPLAGTLLDRSLTSSAKLLRSQHLNPIVGAALYDSIRDTHESETHTGNAAGGAVAFGVFQAGNYLSRALPLEGRLIALATTGAVGAATQASVSKEVSTGALPTSTELAHAALGGAVMNMAMPTAQFMGSHAIENINTKIGRGEPLNRFVANRENATAPEISKLGQIFSIDSINRKANDGQVLLSAAANSPEFKAILDQNQSARILETSDKTAYLPGKDQIALASNNIKPESIAHELTHRDQHLNGESESAFKNAQKLLLNGKTDEAATSYVSARLNFERQAQAKEQSIAQQSGQPLTSRKIAANEKAIVDLKQIAEKESTTFIETKGEFRPTEFLQERNRTRSSADTASQLEQRLAKWDESSFKEKRSIVANLQQAPEHLRAQIFKKAIFEKEQPQSEHEFRSASDQLWLLRGAADRQFKTIPIEERGAVVRSMLDSNEYGLRLLALSHIKDLPASERFPAFKNVLKDSKALGVPQHSRRYGSTEDYRPYISMNRSDVALHTTLHKLPSELLVESISSMKSSERESAWKLAYNHTKREDREIAGDKDATLRDSDTRIAALKNLDVVPIAQRFSLWSREFASASKFNGNSKTVDALIEQIPKLQLPERSAAMHQVFASNTALGSEAMKSAFASLNADEKMPAWQKLFTRSTNQWQTASGQFDENHFLDNLKAEHRDLTSETSNHTPSPPERQSTGYLGMGFGERSYADSYIRPGERFRNTFEDNTIGLNRGLAAAIPALDVADRYDAWQKVIALNPGRTYINDLTKAIPSLPEEIQRTALQALLNRATELNEGIPDSQISPVRRRMGLADKVEPIGLDASNFGAALENLELKQFPMVAETLFSMPPSEMRSALIKSIPVSARISSDALASDLNEPIKHYGDLLATATKLARPEDLPVLEQWWNQITFLEEEDFSNGQYKSNVRDQIAEKIEPKALAHMIFRRTDSENVDAFADAHPEMVRAIAKHSSFFFDNEGESSFTHLENVLHTWNQDYSLVDTTRELLKPVPEQTDRFGDKIDPAHDMMKALYTELFKASSLDQRKQSLDVIKDNLFSADPAVSQIAGETGFNTSFNFPLSLAAQAGTIDNAMMREAFTPSLEDKLHDTSTPYAWKLAAAREVATLQRENVLSHDDISLPDLRLPKLSGLAPSERHDLQKQFLSALFDHDSMQNFIGDGPLGKLMPDHFGRFESEGGIVGRPQHSGHDFDLDVHTLQVMQNIRENPEFETLPLKQQEDVLAAAFMHDLAKLPGTIDENHDWIAPKLAWGILSTMDLPPVRIQRIVNLMARHTDASFSPEELHSRKLDDANTLDDLATFYRHPFALQQLRIMNEADIKAVHADSHLWTPEVAQELDTIQTMASPRVAKLNENLVPILTSELPSRFGFITMDRPYALLAHVSGHMQDSFLKQLNLIQSSAFSVSTSLITDNHRQFYSSGEPVFALFGGPWEQISQAYRDNLGTGTSVDWRGHVELSRDWLTSDRAVSFAKEIDSAAKRSKFQREGSGPLNHLAGARRYYAQFDSFDELVASEGANSPEVKLQRDIHRAITSDADGRPLAKHNEVKLNNPTLIGLGLARGGKSVHFESMPYSTLSRLFSNSDAPPSWASGENTAPDQLPKDAIKISPALWQELLNRDLPIVSLDD